MGLGLVVVLAATLVAAWRIRGEDPDVEWRARDLRDLETGGHRKPPAPWWRRWLGRR